MSRLRYVGILYNPHSDESIQISTELKTYLQVQGIKVWRGTSPSSPDDVELLAEFDLMIAMGGDGTVLRAARIAIPFNIPILTVALGRLNFLAELDPVNLYSGLRTLLNGGGWLDHRTLLQATLYRDGKKRTEFTALNEIVVSRGNISRIVIVDVSIDDFPLTTYRADGVLVATATGSSAYALSAGGPIVDPRSHALVLVPVAAHLTAIHSMVLHEDSIIKLSISSCHHATLSVDGRENLQLYEEDVIEVCRSPTVCTFVRVYHPSQFYPSLVRRLRRE